MGTVPPWMVRHVCFLPTTTGQWWYMAGAASHCLVYPCGWQYCMLFVCMLGSGLQCVRLAL